MCQNTSLNYLKDLLVDHYSIPYSALINIANCNSSIRETVDLIKKETYLLSFDPVLSNFPYWDIVSHAEKIAEIVILLEKLKSLLYVKSVHLKIPSPTDTVLDPWDDSLKRFVHFFGALDVLDLPGITTESWVYGLSHLDQLRKHMAYLYGKLEGHRFFQEECLATLVSYLLEIDVYKSQAKDGASLCALLEDVLSCMWEQSPLSELELHEEDLASAIADPNHEDQDLLKELIPHENGLFFFTNEEWFRGHGNLYVWVFYCAITEKSKKTYLLLHNVLLFRTRVLALRQAVCKNYNKHMQQRILYNYKDDTIKWDKGLVPGGEALDYKDFNNQWENLHKHHEMLLNEMREVLLCMSKHLAVVPIALGQPWHLDFAERENMQEAAAILTKLAPLA